MQTAAWITFGLLVLLAFINLSVGLYFARLIVRAAGPAEPGGSLPKAAVLLPVRGADPHLPEVLRRLLDQDYPDYVVFVVVDDVRDPAWSVVSAALAADPDGRLCVTTLKERRSTCGRKCGALVQMMQDVGPDREVIALIDGDVLTHRTWLRHLVTPLLEPHVGLTFGNRWYAPPRGRLGSLVRYLWNAPSVVMMHTLGAPWAGSCAVRKTVLDEVRAAELWSRAIVDDAAIRTAVVRAGYRVRFVPGLMLINREECSLGFTFHFLTRQLAWTRIYIPTVWAQGVGVTSAVTGIVLSGIVLTGLALVLGMFAEAAWGAAGLAMVVATLTGAVYLIDRAVRRQARARGEEVPTFNLVTLAKIVLGVPAYYALHVAATLAAQFKRTFEWRGVRYRVHGPWDVRVIEDSLEWAQAVPASEESR